LAFSIWGNVFDIMKTRSVKSVCVYCGSSGHADDDSKKAACDVGAVLGRNRIRVVYGGGRSGLMGILADSALRAGGEVVGIIPDFIRAHEVQHNGLTHLHIVGSMHERKRMMADEADAFIVLPGGFGTMDETFEILAWKKLGLHNKPIIIYNANSFWAPLFDLFHHMMKLGFESADTNGIYKVAHNVDEMLEELAEPLGQAANPATKWF